MKTTDKQFKEFKTECERLIKLYNIDNWDIGILKDNTRDDVAACIVRDIEKMGATIYFPDEIDCHKNYVFNTKQTAKHEVIHLLIGKLAEAGKCRYVTEDEFYTIEEELVNKLMKLL